MTQGILDSQAIAAEHCSGLIGDRSAPEKLFLSTAQSLDFWLSVAKKRETMPAHDYLAYLDSFGWSRRNVLPYVKLADFIREHLPLQIGALAKLDIRTLLKLPLPRYAPIVEQIRTGEPTQAQITESIKNLPTKPREKYKSVEEKKDEVFGLNLTKATDEIVSATAQMMGLSKQRAIEENCKLVQELMTGVDPVDAIARFKQQFVSHAEPVKADEIVATELQTDFEPYPVQWHEEGVIHASWVNKVEGDNALLEANDAVYSVPLAELKRININAIKEEINDHKKLSYPYQQLYINAVNAKQEYITLQALPEGDETYDSTLKQYIRWMSCAESGANRNEIWFDRNELEEHLRLVLVPDGEDLIAAVANEPRFKRKEIKTSFLEALYSGVPDVPSLEQRLKDADDWDEIASLVRCNNKTLTQAMETWTIEEKELLITKLAAFLETSFTTAIQDKELSWLHHVSLAKALSKLEFEVNQQVCKFHKFIDYGTVEELWSFKTEQGEVIVVPRNEVKVFRF
ncbi:hypothetical protein COO91_03408 [Nostoc flagelliforme CCNUN1]|uniref:Uncharacterized protein n=1 Tax=Nostoc flagelliforme CCNUN1 TaxID=2038116 RepID=A0A2K8SQ86_9NOSO|nr:hypothetical protein [Nostoc flagelliforme]AUB37463.1 hypothetical protein COO91_03408 [Nostoc flagelliforme CCNUN1]